MLINAASLASWSIVSLGGMPASTEIGCKEKWLMEREGEIRSVTYRSDVWDWEERLGRRAGISRVREDDHSDARRNLLWRRY